MAGVGGDMRGGAPYSLADYGSLGPQAAAQMLPNEHASSACNSPTSLQHHLHSPDPFKSSGVYLHVSAPPTHALRHADSTTHQQHIEKEI